MLKRLLGILFTLAALATFVWVGMGRYTSWCFAGEEAVVEEVLPVPVDTVSADAADPAASADTDPADAAPVSAAPADSEASAAELENSPAAPQEPAADRAESPAAPAKMPAAPADSLSSPAADAVR